MTDNGWVLAVLKENRVVLPVLDFDNGALAYLVTSLFRRSDVPHHCHCERSYVRVGAQQAKSRDVSVDGG